MPCRPHYLVDPGGRPAVVIGPMITKPLSFPDADDETKMDAWYDASRAS